jgi:hypothetical protein
METIVWRPSYGDHRMETTFRRGLGPQGTWTAGISEWHTPRCEKSTRCARRAFRIGRPQLKTNQVRGQVRGHAPPISSSQSKELFGAAELSQWCSFPRPGLTSLGTVVHSSGHPVG